MEFKFQQNLDFQIDAINSIVNIFKSQKLPNYEYEIVPEGGTIPNILSISEKQIIKNLTEVQRSNNIHVSKILNGLNFSVEMETGTGKTYTYLRTVFELYNQYRFKKFIIVVPSVAIREGVLKTLDMTKNHFGEIYQNISFRYYEYDSKKMNLIRQFARGNTVEIMIITLDSFNKTHTIMQQERDFLHGEKPIDLVRRTKPILILDEPQNMETHTAKKALASMEPLFTLRYSATHKHSYNLVYSLNPVEAYNKQLVKKIEVLSVTENDYNQIFLKCHHINADSRGIKAILELDKKVGKHFKRKKIMVKTGDDISKKAENIKYSGFIISEINARYGFIKFTNGKTVNQGETQGDDLTRIMKAQIDQTVKQHFLKYELLKEKRIKPLSLFFIDKVDNYLADKGFIRKAFESSFNKHKKKYKEFKNISAKTVHSGYFSYKKTNQYMKKDKEAFDLIMRDKERLLSFAEPVSFVFSHSALREGWDNPNVFNICTLNHTTSEMKKRQELGRGMRLPVDQDGNRVTEEEHVLTVIANESYESYASKLQQEYEDEYGSELGKINTYDARQKKTLALKKKYLLNPEFKELWTRVAQKTRYEIRIDTDRLIQDCIKEINKMTINKMRIKIENVTFSLEKGKGVITNFLWEGNEESDKKFPITDIIDNMTRETNLTRITIVKILSSINNLDLVFNNPHDFVSSCTIIIHEKLANMLVNGIKYTQTRDKYVMELFEDIKTYRSMIVQAKKTIYDDGVVTDSCVERKFAEELEKRKDVKLFIKLPYWFIIPTPIGKYNPDWAIIRDKTNKYGEHEDRLYLVTETKGTTDVNELRIPEKRKIRCAIEHFRSLSVEFRLVSDIQDLN